MNSRSYNEMLASEPEENSDELSLSDGSRIGVIGGGPAGSFFSYFLLDMAARASLRVSLDIYEPRDFSRSGPSGCNMCGGIISESLVQMLATDGINLPDNVVQRGIDAYVLHTDVGTVKIQTPVLEKRIGAVHRGQGPRGIKEVKWDSFDGHLQKLAIAKGATVIHERVKDVCWQGDKPAVVCRGIDPQAYDLLVICVGVNSSALRMFTQGLDFEPPMTTKTVIREFYLGERMIGEHLGDSMHVFLLDIPRLEFAALIPKGDYASLCMLGKEIDPALVESFLNATEFKQCCPSGMTIAQPECHCSPRINVKGAPRPFGDRLLFVGDCGVTRLYKDGIGAAYRTAKAAAAAAVFQGISAEAFARHYLPACRSVSRDNEIGKIVFLVTRLIKRFRFARRAVLRMVSAEQKKAGQSRHMSMVLWDTFTGSAPYRDILLRTLHPGFVGRFLWANGVSLAKRE